MFTSSTRFALILQTISMLTIDLFLSPTLLSVVEYHLKIDSTSSNTPVYLTQLSS